MYGLIRLLRFATIAHSFTQLILDLPVRTAFDRFDFLVTPSNQEAVGWIDRWPDWPSHVLILVGPPKSGKTHLAKVWQQKATAFSYEPGNMAECLDRAQEGTSICLDINGQVENQEALLHLYNWSREHGASLLVTACNGPKSWEIDLPDLRSRLLASNLASIGAPDDTLLAAVIVKLFSDRQIYVTEDVLRYLLPRIERSFASVADIVERLDRAALSESRAVTVPLAKRILAG